MSTSIIRNNSHHPHVVILNIHFILVKMFCWWVSASLLWCCICLISWYWCDCCLAHLPLLPGIWHHIWEVVTAPDPLSPKFAFPGISGHISRPLIGSLCASLASDWLIVSSPHPPHNLRASIVSISVLTLSGSCRQSPGVQPWPVTNQRAGRWDSQPMRARQCVQGTAQTLHSEAGGLEINDNFLSGMQVF